jgi:hypothetical protein
MSCYISTRENRFYAALEQQLGFAAQISEANRISAVRLSVRQRTQRRMRQDKTGGRTFVGLPNGLRRDTAYELTSYLTGWPPASPGPACGALFQGAMGGAPLVFTGGMIESASGRMIRLTAPHGAVPGQGLSCGGEMRFVEIVADDQTVVLNAPLTNGQAAGWPADRTVTYRPATLLPSVSIYDYWSPDSAVHRLITGAAVNSLRITVNGDFHEFSFSGPAADLLDSATFESGQGGLVEYPIEPEVAEFDYSIVPGNLGQAWLGSVPDRFFTVTSAKIALENNLELSAREFGAESPRCVAGGLRSVTVDVSLFAQLDTATRSLYQAARQRSPMSIMFQMGQQAGQLCGVYLKSVVPEVPEFVDDDNRLEWRFRDCRAQGAADDEITVAFG